MNLRSSFLDGRFLLVAHLVDGKISLADEFLANFIRASHWDVIERPLPAGNSS